MLSYSLYVGRELGTSPSPTVYIEKDTSQFFQVHQRIARYFARNFYKSHGLSTAYKEGRAPNFSKFLRNQVTIWNLRVYPPPSVHRSWDFENFELLHIYMGICYKYKEICWKYEEIQGGAEVTRLICIKKKSLVYTCKIDILSVQILRKKSKMRGWMC